MSSGRRIESKSFMKAFKGQQCVVLRMVIVPRGSGNRALALRLANFARTDPDLSPHVVKVHTGATALDVYLRPSFDMLAAMARMREREEAMKADANQLHLFPGGVSPVPA